METAPSGGAGTGSYADSVDSLSPRSRGGESWDEPFAPSAAVAAAAAAAQAAANSSKLRLMCSYGGQIMPRPHDRTLSYIGGETRIVVVDRHSTLADLQARLSRSLLGGCPFSLKYQLPSEDLDSLISVTTDEDLDNMIEEYDRVVSSTTSSSSAAGGSGKPFRLRLFLFPSKPDSAGESSMGSLLSDSKSETWFVDALNNTMLGRAHSSADSASSVNCLLGLDDSKPSPNSTATGGGGGGDGGIPMESDNEVVFSRGDSSGKLGGRQDVHSVPDSPIVETASSFGSASSAPALSNLPPIRVRPDDRGPNLRAIGAGLEEHFAQMSVSDQQRQQQQQQQVDAEGFNPHLQPYPPLPPQPVNAIPLTTAATLVPTSTNIPPTEKPNTSRDFSADDDKSDHGGVQRSSLQQPQHQQQHQQLQQQQQHQQLQQQQQYQQLQQQHQQLQQQHQQLQQQQQHQQLQQQQQHQQLQQQRQPQQNPNFQDLPISGDAVARPVYCQEKPPSAAAAKQEAPLSDAGYRFPVQVTDKGYVLQSPQPPQPMPMQAVDLLQSQQSQAHQFVPANPHLVHHHASGIYYQMPFHPQQQQQQQQQLPQTAQPYNPQMQMYSLPVRQNHAYALPVQPTMGDATVAAPVPSSAANPSIPPPNAPPRPELAANMYRTGISATGPGVAQPLQPTPLIPLAAHSQQYVGYHSMPQHRPQSAAPLPAAGYGYEFSDAIHPQQVYYTQAASATLPHQYQPMTSSGAVMAELPPALQQQGDGKQTKSS